MVDATVLTLIDGVRVVVPDALDLITPYVLREQQDYFEDELPFVRSFLTRGMKVIDIGANYGVYTLPMAQRVGPTGHVWAFEPASSTAEFLARGVTENGFSQVTLEQKAVSGAPGSAQLSSHVHAELRSISHDSSAPKGGEIVSLVTLDDCMDRYGWSAIDFIKIDAEGEESSIVRGGRRFFARLEPLVQYELRKTAADMNFDLVREFAAIGYESYRLSPGLNLLVPFDLNTPSDHYLLNLFSCNAACAERLAARGILVRRQDLAAVEAAGKIGNESASKYHWRHALAPFAYAAPLQSTWTTAQETGTRAELVGALSLYARSRDEDLSMAVRFRALQSSFLQMSSICDRDSSSLRLASLARIAHDYGARAASVTALARLTENIRRTGSVDTAEPFLAPLERFESVSPGEVLGSWILAATLEQLEKREAFSTFYVGPRALDRLEAIDALGFGGPDMRRRLELVRLRIEGARAAKTRPADAAGANGSR